MRTRDPSLWLRVVLNLFKRLGLLDLLISCEKFTAKNSNLSFSKFCFLYFIRSHENMFLILYLNHQIRLQLIMLKNVPPSNWVHDLNRG